MKSKDWLYPIVYKITIGFGAFLVISGLLHESDNYLVCRVSFKSEKYELIIGFANCKLVWPICVRDPPNVIVESASGVFSIITLFGI